MVLFHKIIKKNNFKNCYKKIDLHEMIFENTLQTMLKALFDNCF